MTTLSACALCSSSSISTHCIFSMSSGSAAGAIDPDLVSYASAITGQLEWLQVFLARSQLSYLKHLVMGASDAWGRYKMVPGSVSPHKHVVISDRTFQD